MEILLSFMVDDFIKNAKRIFNKTGRKMKLIEELKRYLAKSTRIVFLGGAGVSTESGIPDFRSAQGLYQKKAYLMPEEILSHTFFHKETAAFFDFYRANMLYPQASPNLAHQTLACWEREGKLQAVVTQNIDGLHQKAGSRKVLELHGSIYSNHCLDCARKYGLEMILNTQGIPRCPYCGGIIKPDVVLYEEKLNEKVLGQAISAISDADLLIVGGTSLNVSPAAGLIRYLEKGHLVLLNQTATDMDGYADLVIHDTLGHIFSQLQEEKE